MLRFLKWAGLTLLLLLAAAAVGGWFWAQEAMKPKPNLATVEAGLVDVDIRWAANQFSDRAGLFLPVTLPGVPGVYYMQFDLGSELTVFYGPAIRSLDAAGIGEWTPSEEYPGHITDVAIEIGGVQAVYARAPVIGYGAPVETQPEDFQVIGTIGSDFARRKTLLIDFVASRFVASEADRFDWPDAGEVEMRSVRGWLQLRACMEGRRTWVMWDTGASPFQLITSQGVWRDMATDPSTAVSQDMNSWGRTVTAHIAETDHSISFGEQTIEIDQVAYFEGFPWFVQVLMGVSGMRGMVGNGLFQHHAVLVDMEAGQLAILPGRTLDAEPSDPVMP
jgi:hypothetical protein